MQRASPTGLPSELIEPAPRGRAVLRWVKGQAIPAYVLGGAAFASLSIGIVLLARGSEAGLVFVVLLTPLLGSIALFHGLAYREAVQIARYGEHVPNAVVSRSQMRLKSQNIDLYVVGVMERGIAKTAQIVAPGPVGPPVFVFSIPGARTRLAVFVVGQGMTAQRGRG